MKRIQGEWRYFDERLSIPYPWYTRPCLEFMEKMDFRFKRVWEYGVGDSTAWYRAKGAYCVGVDNDLDWCLKTSGAFCKPHYPEYCNKILEAGFFDIVIIDGAWRDLCTEFALKQLKPGGLLIIDNYKQKTADLEHWPLTEKLIEGMDVKYFKEPDHIDWQTIVVTK